MKYFKTFNHVLLIIVVMLLFFGYVCYDMTNIFTCKENLRNYDYTDNIPYVDMHTYLTTDYDVNNPSSDYIHYELDQIEETNNPPYKMDDFSSNLTTIGVENDFKYFNNFTKMKQGKINTPFF